MRVFLNEGERTKNEDENDFGVSETRDQNENDFGVSETRDQNDE